MPSQDWKLLASGPATDYGIFAVRRDRYRLERPAGAAPAAEPASAERDFIVIEANDWVNVVAVTADRQIVLIRQFRHGIRDVAWEVPGGIIETGEPVEEAALRELREETGYAGARARVIGSMWPNPAMQNNRLFTCLVENAEHVGPPQPDPFERIVVEPRPLAEIPGMIGSGVIRHSLVIASLALCGIAATVSPPGEG